MQITLHLFHCQYPSATTQVAVDLPPSKKFLATNSKSKNNLKTVAYGRLWKLFVCSNRSVGMKPFAVSFFLGELL